MGEQVLIITARGDVSLRGDHARWAANDYNSSEPAVTSGADPEERWSWELLETGAAVESPDVACFLSPPGLPREAWEHTPASAEALLAARPAGPQRAEVWEAVHKLVERERAHAVAKVKADELDLETDLEWSMLRELLDVGGPTE